MPIALLFTEPVPVPPMPSVSVRTPTAVKIALTICDVLTCFVQGSDPVQPPPDQWSKIEPSAGTAVRGGSKFERTRAGQPGPRSNPSRGAGKGPPPVAALTTDAGGGA